MTHIHSYCPSDCLSAYSNVYSVLSSTRWRHLAITPHPIVSVIIQSVRSENRNYTKHLHIVQEKNQLAGVNIKDVNNCARSDQVTSRRFKRERETEREGL